MLLLQIVPMPNVSSALLKVPQTHSQISSMSQSQTERSGFAYGPYGN